MIFEIVFFNFSKAGGVSLVFLIKLFLYFHQVKQGLSGLHIGIDLENLTARIKENEKKRIGEKSDKWFHYF